MSGNFENINYKVVEEYLGKNIEVSVREGWKNGKIEEAYISCFGYSPMIKGISHKLGNYRPSENGGVVGEIVKHLSVEDVHDAIFKEIYNAERSIAKKRGVEHDNFYVTRHFHIDVDYKDQKVPVTFMVRLSTTLKKKVEFDRGFIIYGHEIIGVSADNFRNEIIKGVHYGMNLVDNGYIFPVPSIFSKVKKKIKKIF